MSQPCVDKRPADGFLTSIRIMDQNNSVSFIQMKKAWQMMQNRDLQIEDLLKMRVGDERY
ncbi:MAG: hypothetical protein IT257_10505 [Chitinophagaceae bacterium]|nr:hypothetical protein [Chitinophagaceae bacterium]